jgi:hypothetical protein
MDNVGLAEQFQQGVNRDYTLNEYEALRYFIKQTQPQTIKCVGGYSNMDLFYSCQDLKQTAKAWNWDSCGFIDEDHMRGFHKKYQQLTDWKGDYQWIPRSLGHLNEIGESVDLLWLNALQHEANDIENLKSIVVVHYGSPFIVDDIVRLSKKCPLRAIGRRMAILSKEDIDMTQGPFPTKKQKFFFNESVVEVLR